MDNFYFVVDYGKDPLKVFSTYFKTGTWMGNGFLEALIIAIIVAIIGIVLFYYVIGKTSFKLSTMTTWSVTILMVGLFTFFVTGYNTGLTSESPRFGLAKTLNNRFKDSNHKLNKESATYKKNQKDYKKLKKEFKKGSFSVAPVRNLCLENSVIAMLLFVGLSFPARKGPTDYCRNIPIK